MNRTGQVKFQQHVCNNKYTFSSMYNTHCIQEKKKKKDSMLLRALRFEPNREIKTEHDKESKEKQKTQCNLETDLLCICSQIISLYFFF